jgi:hypothetical protein
MNGSIDQRRCCLLSPSIIKLRHILESFFKILYMHHARLANNKLIIGDLIKLSCLWDALQFISEGIRISFCMMRRSIDQEWPAHMLEIFKG